MEGTPGVNEGVMPAVWRIEIARIESKGEVAVIERGVMKDGSWHEIKNPDIKGIFAERRKTGIIFYHVNQNDQVFKRSKSHVPVVWGWGAKVSKKEDSSDAELSFYYLHGRS